MIWCTSTQFNYAFAGNFVVFFQVCQYKLSFLPRNFELFKSNVCHQVKKQGDIDFLIATLESKIIRDYYNQQWYRESFYLLAMVDYMSRENQIPLCSDYDDLRCQKLQEPQYPASVLVTASVMDCSDVKEQVLAQAIPEFLRHNIVENDVRNII